MAGESITASVGEGGVNRYADIKVIQTLLNRAGAILTVDGKIGAKTIIAIKAYQSNFLSRPDGKVDPGPRGRTFSHLLEGKLKVKVFRLELVQLPQMSGNGYYSYSTSDRQWGTAECIKTLLEVCGTFRRNSPNLEIALGDISFAAGGRMSPHSTHREGLHTDIRPLRTDGKHLPVTITDKAYSHENTKLLVDSLLVHRNVKAILFNDPKIKGVGRWSGHDNHLHVTMRK